MAKAGQTLMDFTIKHKQNAHYNAGLLKSGIAGASVSSLRSPSLAELKSDLGIESHTEQFGH